MQARVFVVVQTGRDGWPRGVDYISGTRFYRTEEDARHSLEQVASGGYGVFPAQLVIEAEKSSRSYS